MRTIFATLALSFGAAALAGPAAALTQEELDGFLAAAAQADCIVSEATIGPIVAMSGISEAALYEVIAFLAENDGTEVAADQTSMRIVAGPCAG
ncbi:hypothetical protein [Wenxinia saemankumensis]|uniref:HdeA/HdeB family protein n=1 Tax=Wenxinia saemankumensis TaxID=1447782 RepID=A0A1M6HEL4_9RHOB|nr:hypothetical protein [Wenxinia saemankumensis]SHJ20645.1 hypothetical protein SAMN05444417_3193 [Wenxinia saemankumensis]